MSTETLDYASFLANLEAKRAALDAAIAAVRTAMAMGALGTSSEVPASMVGALTHSMNGNEVPAGAFFGKSIPEAARLYLAIVKRKQTSKEIADGLRKGGMESTSKNFPQILHSGLDRARRLPGSPLVKLDRSHWGLREWYPAGIGIAPSNDKRGRKKTGRRGKTAKSATMSLHAASPEPQKVKVNERIMELVRTKPEREYSLAQIAEHLGMGTRGARLALGKLLKAGKVKLSAPGMYAIERHQLAAVV